AHRRLVVVHHVGLELHHHTQWVRQLNAGHGLEHVATLVQTSGNGPVVHRDAGVVVAIVIEGDDVVVTDGREVAAVNAPLCLVTRWGGPPAVVLSPTAVATVAAVAAATAHQQERNSANRESATGLKQPAPVHPILRHFFPIAHVADSNFLPYS